MGGLCTTDVKVLPDPKEVLKDTQIPEWVSTGGQKLFQQAAELGASPFPEFTGDRISTYEDIYAPGQTSRFTEREQKGLSLLDTQGDVYKPYLERAGEVAKDIGSQRLESREYYPESFGGGGYLWPWDFDRRIYAQQPPSRMPGVQQYAPTGPGGQLAPSGSPKGPPIAQGGLQALPQVPGGEGFGLDLLGSPNISASKPGAAPTGAPQGFIPPAGPATHALVPYINPSTGETWTAPSGGFTAPEGWEVDRQPRQGLPGPPGGYGDFPRPPGAPTPDYASMDKQLQTSHAAAQAAMNPNIESGFYSSDEYQALPKFGQRNAIQTKYFGQLDGFQGGMDAAYESYLNRTGQPAPTSISQGWKDEQAALAANKEKYGPGYSGLGMDIGGVMTNVDKEGNVLPPMAPGQSPPRDPETGEILPGWMPPPWDDPRRRFPPKPYPDQYAGMYQEAIQPALQDVSETFARQRRDLGAAAGRTGAFGDRTGLESAELTRGEARERGRLSQEAGAKGLEFSSAQFERDRAARERAFEMNRTGRERQFDLEQSSRRMEMEAQERLAPAAQGLVQQQAQGLIGAGEAQRALDQQALEMAYRDYVEQREYPFTALNFALGALKGLPYETREFSMQRGGQFFQQPSVYGQTMGGLGALASAYKLLGT